MRCRVILSQAGICEPSLRKWQEASFRINRIHMPIEGCAIYRDVGKQSLLECGSIYLLINSCSQNFEMVTGNRYYHLYIDFQTAPPLMGGALLEIGRREDPFLRHLLDAVQDLIVEHCSTNGYDPITEQSAPELFLQIERLLDVAVQYMGDRYRLAVVESTKIEQAIAYVEEHYAEPIRIEDISRALLLDTRYLIRLFNRFMDMPPYQYLTQCRIEHAVIYLRNGKNVGETADLCGYQSESAFRIAFKKVMGCAPTAFLKQI